MNQVSNISTLGCVIKSDIRCEGRTPLEWAIHRTLSDIQLESHYVLWSVRLDRVVIIAEGDVLLPLFSQSVLQKDGHDRRFRK